MTAEHKTSSDSGKMPLPWRMYFVLIILGLGTIFAISYGFQKGLTISARQAPQLDAAMEIMLEVTTAHLVLEEIIEENRFEDIDSIWRHLDQADWYSQALLEGGSSEEGIFLPLADVRRRAQIREIRTLLDVLRKVTERRLDAARGDGSKSEAKRMYNTAFNQITSLADDVETQLQAVFSSDLRRFRYTQWGLLVGCFLLWLSIGLILHRFEQRRSLLLQADKVANESLHAEIALREEAEKVLRESEERFRSLVETTPDWIWETDRNNVYTYVSPKVKDLLGYNPDEVIGKTPYDLMPADEIQRVGKITEDIARVCEPIVSLENTALHKDGRRIVIETSGVPILDANGKLLGYRGIDRDMTERKRSEEERLSYLHFLESVEKIDATFRGGTDLEKVLEDVMGTVLSIFNCDRAWLLYPCDPTATTFNVPIERTRPEYPGAYAGGRNVPLTKKDMEFCRRALESDAPFCVREEENQSTSSRISPDFGVRSLMIISVNPKVGKPWVFGLHQCSYAREWTTAEQQLFKEIGHRVADNLGILLLLRDLRNNEATMAEAQRIAQFGNWEWDVRTGEVQWSEEIYRMLGLDPNNFQPQIDRILALSPPEDRNKDKELIELAIINHESRSYEHRFIQPDGSIVTLDSTFEGRYDEQGNLLQIVGVAQNITERKRAELALRKTQAELFAREKREKELVEAELEKARQELVSATRLATLGQLTATVSHELRNPLGSIRTAVFSIAEEIRGQAPLIDRALARAERNIIRCDQIIEELLDYTRANKPLLKPTRIDPWLGKVLDEQDIPKHITLLRNFDADIEINVDRDQLRRCLINLLTNACQAMTKTPAAKAQLTVETLVKKERLLINVQDTGRGISSDQMDKIFEPLYTTKGFGTGLGLAVVEQLIKQLGGKITIKSEIDRGTVASLWLPLTPNNNP